MWYASKPPASPHSHKIQVSAATTNLTLRLAKVSAANEEVVVTADVGKIDIASPDPSQKVMVREELLDANPGRPGAPISIPGLPIETASGGIKAPQYFAPGVAGDHGEPIAQYIAVGGYLVPNNLSANAHGISMRTRISMFPERWAAWRPTAGRTTFSKAITRST